VPGSSQFFLQANLTPEQLRHPRLLLGELGLGDGARPEEGSDPVQFGLSSAPGLHLFEEVSLQLGQLPDRDGVDESQFNPESSDSEPFLRQLLPETRGVQPEEDRPGLHIVSGAASDLGHPSFDHRRHNVKARRDNGSLRRNKNSKGTQTDFNDLIRIQEDLIRRGAKAGVEAPAQKAHETKGEEQEPSLQAKPEQPSLRR